MRPKSATPKPASDTSDLQSEQTKRLTCGIDFVHASSGSHLRLWTPSSLMRRQNRFFLSLLTHVCFAQVQARKSRWWGMDAAHPNSALSAPRVRVVQEQERARGWEYLVEIRLSGNASEHSVSLCHRDHDYWSGGLDAPSRTVERVLSYLLEAGIAKLPPKFDCSTARAWCRRVDRSIDADLRAA